MALDFLKFILVFFSVFNFKYEKFTEHLTRVIGIDKIQTSLNLTRIVGIKHIKIHTKYFISEIDGGDPCYDLTSSH